MKRLLILSLLTLIIVIGCQTNEEVIPNQKTEVTSIPNVKQSTISGAGNSDLNPTTPEDLGFEYEEGSDRSTASVIFKYTLVKIVFSSSTTEEQKNNLRANFSVNTLNGWSFFYSEKCTTLPNVEFWTLRIDQANYVDATTNDPVKAIKDYIVSSSFPNNEANDPDGDDPADIQCSEVDAKTKQKECI